MGVIDQFALVKYCSTVYSGLSLSMTVCRGMLKFTWCKGGLAMQTASAHSAWATTVRGVGLSLWTRSLHCSAVLLWSKVPVNTSTNNSR